MKKLMLLLGLFFWGCLGYLTFLNLNIPVELKVLAHHSAINTHLCTLISVVSLIAIAGSFLISYPFVIDLKSKISKKERTLEKASVETEASVDKVKALEAKIQTLEIALQQALKKN